MTKDEIKNAKRARKAEKRRDKKQYGKGEEGKRAKMAAMAKEAAKKKAQRAQERAISSVESAEGASMYSKKHGTSMSGEKYDAKEAYNKNLSASARLHYLENNRADKKAKGKGQRSSIMKHMKGF